MRRALGKGGGDLRAHGELQVPDGDGGVAAREQQAGDRRVSIAAAQAAAAAAAAAAVTLTSGKTGDGEPIIHHSTDRVRRLLLAYPSCGHSSSSLSRAAGTRRRRRHSLLFFSARPALPGAWEQRRRHVHRPAPGARSLRRSVAG